MEGGRDLRRNDLRLERFNVAQSVKLNSGKLGYLFALLLALRLVESLIHYAGTCGRAN